MRANTQKTIYLGAASFLLSLAAIFGFGEGLTLLSALLICAACGAYAMIGLLSASKIRLLIPTAVVVCGFFITMDIPSAILALVPFALGAIISSCAKKRSEKTSAVVFCDVALGAILIVSLALAYYIQNKTLSATAVVSDINAMFDSAKAMLAEMFEKMDIYSIYSLQYDLSSVSEAEFCLDMAEDMILITKMISPAMIICVLNVISYISCAMFSLVAKILGESIAIPNGKWYLMPSAVSCWVMVISTIIWYFTSLFSSSSTSLVVEYAAANLIIILALPMFVCGVRGLYGKFRSPSYKGSAVMITVIAVVMVFFNVLYSVLFIALEGAWDMIGYHRMMKRSANKQ